MILLAYVYAGLIIAAVVFTPMILGWAVGLIWGGLTKLGVVGKIVNTLLMVVISGILGLVPVGIVQNSGSYDAATATLAFSTMILATILIPVWYFFWHHDVVKEMGIVAFSAHVVALFMIAWYGGGLGLIVSLFNQQTGNYIAIGSVLAGIVYYAIATRADAGNVDRDDSASFKYRWIGLAAAVCLAVPLVLWTPGFMAEQTAREAENKAANEAGVVTAKAAKNKKQEAFAAEYVSGTVLFVRFNGTIKMYEEANESSKVIKEFRNKGGEKLIANGEVLFKPASTWQGFVSVDYNGTKGWMEVGHVIPAIGIATVVADKVEFKPDNTWDANGQPIKHPNIALKKGDTFEVLRTEKDKKDKKYTRTTGVYKGTLGVVGSRDEVITINK